MSVAIVADAFSTTAYDYWDNKYGYGYSAESVNDAALSNTHIEGGNSLARALNEALEANKETDKEAMPVSIHNAEVNRTNKTITVDYSSTTEATIIVALYDDECTKMLTSSKAEVEYNDSGTVTVTMDSLPQYFYLKAYAVEDVTSVPLSDVYENYYYTKEWQEFFSKTTDDFSPDRVINFDDDKTKNFAALYGDTANIMSDGMHNVVISADYDNMIFVIGNPDEKITGLTVGQKAVIWGTAGEFIITRVSWLIVDEDGSQATIYGENLAPEDVFEHFNYDMSTEGQDLAYEPNENQCISLDIPEEDLEEIERWVEEYKAQQIACQEQVSEIQEQVSEDQEQVSENPEQVTENQEEEPGSQEQVTENQEEVSETQEQASEIQEQVSEYQEQVSENQEEESDNQAQVSENQTQESENQEQDTEYPEQYDDMPQDMLYNSRAAADDSFTITIGQRKYTIKIKDGGGL